MSRIDELIQDLCPAGVPFHPLGALGTRNKGTSMTATRMRETDTGGPVRLFAGGSTVADVDEASVPAKAVVREPSIIVKSRGHIGFTYYDRPFSHKSELWSYTLSDPVVNQKFIYYYLLTRTRHLQDLARATSVKLPQLSVGDTDGLKVPVPPREVQDEIVKILDTFSALTAELEAELEAELAARRTQYEHYRNALVTQQVDEVTWVPLGEVTEIRSGWGFPRKYQGVSTGSYPFYKVSDMNVPGNGAYMYRANNYLEDDQVSDLGVKLAPAGTIIFPKIGAAVATNKKRALTQPSGYDNNVMGLIPGAQVDSRYLYHWMMTVNLSEVAHDSGAVPSIRRSEMQKLPFPLPNVEDQERVIHVLDRFEDLTSSLASGLPAEIEARRRQYEFYRDRLLSFEEAPA